MIEDIRGDGGDGGDAGGEMRGLTRSGGDVGVFVKILIFC